LLVCSIDKAEQIGLNWWRFDPNLTRRIEGENAELRERLAELERAVRQLSAPAAGESSQPHRRRSVGAKKKGRARP
jgi:hypothetical protein